MSATSSPQPPRAPAPPDFDAFVGARAPALLRFAYVLTGTGDEADAVTEAALAEAHAWWRRLTTTDGVDERLRREAVRAYLRRHRRRRDRTARDRQTHPVESHSGPEDAPRDARYDPDVVWARCTELPALERAVLVLRCYDGRYADEIAPMVGVRARAVRRALEAALETVAPSAPEISHETRLRAVRRALDAHDEDAPAPYSAAARAASRSGVRRRRRMLRVVVAATVLALPLAWAVGRGGEVSPEPRIPPVQAFERPPLDVGDWRWESWGGVQVQVPDTWGHGDLTQWCVTRGPDGPAVDRPEIIGTNALCALNDLGRPTYTGGLVLRQASDDIRISRADVAPYAVTRIHTVGSVTLTVVDIDPAVGSAILGSAEVIGRRDFNGCRPERLQGRAGRRIAPLPATPVRRISSVDSVSVCRYGLAGWDRPTLIWSERLSGAAADEALQALRAAAPLRRTRSSVAPCPRAVEGFGVLELWVDDRPSSVLVRYDPCGGHRLDDGTAVRRLLDRTLDARLVPPWTGEGIRDGNPR